MGLVARLSSLAGAITLDGHGEDDGGPLNFLARSGIGCIHLVGVMAAPIEIHDVLITEVFDQLERLGVFPEEVLAGVGATVELAVLELTVTHLIHDLLQESALVALDQRVPLAPPNHLDDMPAGAPKNSLQLLDDFSVTAHRTIQSLQVTVDHKVQVAQPLAASERNRAQRLGLITFAVSEETPDLAVSVIDQTAFALILHHVGLIDGLNRSQPHRHGGELPVVGHEPRVRIRREASPPNFPTEIFELLLADDPLKIGARIHARRTVPLVIHQITGMAVGRAAKEMIHPYVIERGARGKT